MSAERRYLIVALAAVVVAVAVVVLVLSGGDDGNTTTRPRETSPAEAQLARDRTQIAQIAERYQRALDPHSQDNPCRYMTKLAWSSVVAKVDPNNPPEGYREARSPIEACAAAVRASEGRDAVPLYQATPLGVTNIEFRRRVPVAGPEGQAPGAIATWRAAGHGQVSFVRDEAGQWRIAE